MWDSLLRTPTVTHEDKHQNFITRVQDYILTNCYLKPWSVALRMMQQLELESLV